MSNSRELTRASYLINEEDYVSIDIGSDESRLIDSTVIEPNLNPPFFERTCAYGPMSSELVFHIMDFLPNPDLANLSEASWTFNGMAKETMRGREILKFIEIQPACPSACFSYFSGPEGYRRLFPYAFSFTTTALSAAIGYAVPNYVFDNQYPPKQTLSYLICFSSSLFGSTIGSCAGTFFSIHHNNHYILLNAAASIAGGAVGAGVTTATLLAPQISTNKLALVSFLSSATGATGSIVGNLLGSMGSRLGLFAHKKNTEYLEEQAKAREEVMENLRNWRRGVV